MKDPIRMSVLVCTRNRSQLLASCLKSLVNQTCKPFEVVVVDNGSTDATRSVCQKYQHILPLLYKAERRVGVPFARNTAIQAASGDICAFIDDDCIANTNWINEIHNHFSSNSQNIGLIGFTNNLYPNNIYSCVEYFYYIRWVIQNVSNINASQAIQSGLFIDTKNAAFKRTVLQKFPFSINVPFGDMGMMEDVEFGDRVMKAHKRIFFAPSVQVKHAFSTSLDRLMLRNFWEGFGSEILLIKTKINTKVVPKKYSTMKLLTQIFSRRIFIGTKIQPLTILLVLLFPIASISGRIYARLTQLLHQPTIIPQR